MFCFCHLSGSDALSRVESGVGLGSASSIRGRQFLENSVNWLPIVTKYRSLKVESPD